MVGDLRDIDHLDQLLVTERIEAVVHFAAHCYVGESITFPYVAAGADWIDQSGGRTYFWGNRSTADAESSSAAVTAAGSVASQA